MLDTSNFLGEKMFGFSFFLLDSKNLLSFYCNFFFLETTRVNIQCEILSFLVPNEENHADLWCNSLSLMESGGFPGQAVITRILPFSFPFITVPILEGDCAVV